MSKKRDTSYISHSLQKKAEAIREVISGKLKSEVAKAYDIPRTTLDAWLKKQDKILSAVDQSTFNSGRKRMRMSTHADVEEALMTWFRHVRAQNIPVSGQMLSTKAEDFAKQLGCIDFTCSEGWLERFKERHGVSLRTVSGVANSAPLVSVSEWRNVTLPPLLREYAPRDIYNAAETAMFWQLLPSNTSALKGETCSGGKQSKQRITVLLMANMDGSDKRKLFVIGKYHKPRCFSGVQRLPVTYTANKKAWMVSDMFVQYVQKFDREMAMEHRSVLLIVDNCPAHPVIEGLKTVRLRFLPPNTTSHTQPMDAGVIRNFKLNYRRLLLLRLIQAIDDGNKEFVPDLLLGLHLMKQAWDAVLPTTIANCYRHCGFQVNDFAHPSPDLVTETSLLESRTSLVHIFDRLRNLQLVPLGITPDDYVYADDQVSVAEMSAENDVINSVLSKKSLREKDEEPNRSDVELDHGPPPPPVKLSEAIRAVDTLQLYLAQHDIDDTPYNLNRLASVLVNKVSLNSKQPQITDFFRL